MCIHKLIQQIFEQRWWWFTVILSQIFFVRQNLLNFLQIKRHLNIYQTIDWFFRLQRQKVNQLVQISHMFFFHRFFGLWTSRLLSRKLCVFHCFFIAFQKFIAFSLSLFSFKESFWFFLWLCFFIAFSLSNQKVNRFFIIASDDIMPTS